MDEPNGSRTKWWRCSHGMASGSNTVAINSLLAYEFIVYSPFHRVSFDFIAKLLPASDVFRLSPANLSIGYILCGGYSVYVRAVPSALRRTPIDFPQRSYLMYPLISWIRPRTRNTLNVDTSLVAVTTPIVRRERLQLPKNYRGLYLQQTHKHAVWAVGIPSLDRGRMKSLGRIACGYSCSTSPRCRWRSYICPEFFLHIRRYRTSIRYTT